MKPAKSFSVIVGSDIIPPPSEKEISVAVLLSNRFKVDVKFIPRSSIHTADILIDNVEWEIKSPTGNGKRNIQHQLTRALYQSKNIIFDARYSKIDMNKIVNEVQRQFRMTQSIKRLIIVKKNYEIIELVK